MNKRKNRIAIIAIILIHCFSASLHAQKEPVDYVDPFIGTNDSRPMTFPGATLPFGMVKFSPDNQESGWKAGHDYNINNIAGFNFIHDYHVTGFYVLPICGDIMTQPGAEDDPDSGYRSRISHNTESATPGYYSVMLDDYGIKAELSATMRTGIQRYTFPESNKAAIMFDMEIPYENPGKVLDVQVSKVNEYEIEGYVKIYDEAINLYTIWLKNDYYLYFIARFDKPFQSLGGWNDNLFVEDTREIRGKGDVGFFVRYETEANEQINVHTAISMVSQEQARLNLDTETSLFGFNFDAYVDRASNIWNELLGRISIESNDEGSKTKFYTNLYRVYSSRTVWSDVNGKWVDMNEDIIQSPNSEPVYGCDAFWGMRWNLNGLWSLVNPGLMNSWVKSLLQIYKQGGWLPKGPTAGEYTAIMTSSPAVPLIIASYQQGIRGYDVDLAYESIVKIMMEQGVVHQSGGFAGNRWLQPYMDYGYVPYEKGPASVTMELAFQDWCVAQMAKSLSREEDYKYFLKRSLNYRNHLDSEVKFARTRSMSGDWIEPFVPFSSDGFIEGNPWQYTFFAPHDVQGIINFTGKELFIERLDWGFESSRKSKFNATHDNYAKYPINHGNQPNMQAAFLYNYVGEPWKTQKWVKEILNIYYGKTPADGWPGDEDEGQMGGWFVMSSLGLFQMQGGCGSEPIYDLTGPLFDEAVINLENGKTLSIIAKNLSKDNIYIQSARLNGNELNQCWIFCKDIQYGGELEYEMGSKPNKTWGSDSLPPSISKPNEMFTPVVK